MTASIALFLAGALTSWVITHIYFRFSSTSVPEWAKPIIEKLPEQAPSGDELLRLFQESLDSGEVKPDPILGHVACPECGAPSSEFEHRTFGDDSVTVVSASCPRCGWSESGEA